MLGNRREKKLISAERSRKALLRRKRLSWVLKSEQNFQTWYCGVWHGHPKNRESHEKSHIFGKVHFGFQESWFVLYGKEDMR